ncbi:hypothetical protein [Geodermatophilus chilensis]|uniref:hypothetical protein n=1 Tax=Geodermatophilus chilensis TaxID=2035835 RepID=UPI001E4119DE|nr:hypothetical protein [Geodermatophilus chilensis]
MLTGVDTAQFSAEVEAAARRLAGVAERTPLQRNARLSDATGADVWLKREDLQVGRSYKIRGRRRAATASTSAPGAALNPSPRPESTSSRPPSPRAPESRRLPRSPSPRARGRARSPRGVRDHEAAHTALIPRYGRR